MIKTPLSTVIGGAFWTPGSTMIGGAKLRFETVMKKLFANGEQGFAYDPNDLSTMFQDAAGTVPVTGVGQAVGLIRDKSGRNNHAYQTASASRPILRKNAVTGANYLEFDGTDDSLQTNNIDFTATDKVSLFAGLRKLSDAKIGVVAELSPQINSNNGSFTVFAPGGASPRIDFLSKGTVIGTATYSGGLAAAPVSAVVTGVGDISGDRSILKVDGAIVSTSVVDQGTGNYGNYPLYIGRREGTSLPFNGHIYGLIGVGKLTSVVETTTIEKELAKRLGVTLNV